MCSSRIGRLEQTVKDTIIILKEKRLRRKIESQTCHLVRTQIVYVPSHLLGNLILSDFILKVSSLPPVFHPGQVLLRKWGGTIWGSWKIPGYTGGHKYPHMSGLMTSVLCQPWPEAAGVLSIISCRNDRQRNVWTEEGPLRAFLLVMQFPLRLVQWLPAYMELGCSALMSQRGQEAAITTGPVPYLLGHG